MTDRIDDVVDDIRVAAPGDVVEAPAHRQIVAHQVKTLFKLRVQREVVGITFGAGRADELLLRVEQAEGESGAGLDRVGEFGFVQNRQLEKWNVSPREKAIRRVPRIRPGLLAAENWIVNVEVERLIGTR